MKRSVVWSRAARADLHDVVAYIAEDNPAAARRVAGAVTAAAHALGDTPSGRPGRVAGTYEKVVRGLPYLLAYAIDARPVREQVVIVRLIHGARDWTPESWPEG